MPYVAPIVEGHGEVEPIPRYSIESHRERHRTSPSGSMPRFASRSGHSSMTTPISGNRLFLPPRRPHRPMALSLSFSTARTTAPPRWDRPS